MLCLHSGKNVQPRLYKSPPLPASCIAQSGYANLVVIMKPMHSEPPTKPHHNSKGSKGQSYTVAYNDFGIFCLHRQGAKIIYLKFC